VPTSGSTKLFLLQAVRLPRCSLRHVMTCGHVLLRPPQCAVLAHIRSIVSYVTARAARKQQ